MRVLWRPREELWEGRWKIRFKISKTSNIPICKLTATPIKPPSMFVFLLEPGKLGIKFTSFGRKT